WSQHRGHGFGAAGAAVPGSPAGRAAGADVVVDVETGPDYRRVAQAPGDFDNQAACRRRADDVAARGARVAVDGALRPEVLHAVFLDVPADVGVLFLLVPGRHPVVLARQLLLPVEPDF